MKNYIYLQALSQGIGTVLSIGMLLFLSAGTVDYAGAWIFLGTISCCAVVFALWLKFKHPKQFENRMYTKETDRNQRSIVRDIGCFLCCSLVLSGLDRRFSWSHIPEWRYTIAVALFLASAAVYRNVFIVNPYLSNTVIIHRDHAVIQEGMYGIVRHPMYLASFMAYAAGMIMLDTLLLFPLCCGFTLLLVRRAKKEEIQLMTKCQAYKSYMARVKFRLIPYIL